MLFGEKKIIDRKNYDPFEEHIRRSFRYLLSNMDLALMKWRIPIDSRPQMLSCLDYKYERLPIPNLEENLKNEISKIISSTSWVFESEGLCF